MIWVYLMIRPRKPCGSFSSPCCKLELLKQHRLIQERSIRAGALIASRPHPDCWVKAHSGESIDREQAWHRPCILRHRLISECPSAKRKTLQHRCGRSRVIDDVVLTGLIGQPAAVHHKSAVIDAVFPLVEKHKGLGRPGVGYGIELEELAPPRSPFSAGRTPTRAIEPHVHRHAAHAGYELPLHPARTAVSWAFEHLLGIDVGPKGAVLDTPPEHPDHDRRPHRKACAGRRPPSIPDL